MPSSNLAKHAKTGHHSRMTEITARLSTALADRYQIEHELGASVMATVYLAHAPFIDWQGCT